MADNEIKRVITIESSESLNTLNHLNARIKELRGSMGDLDITTEEYRQVSEEVARLENVRGNAMRGNTAALEGSYNAYSKELSILQKHRKTLQENSDEYKEMTTRVAELQEKLKAMDAEVGMFQRNVGNYESAFDGLQGSVNSVVAQLPNLKNGFVGFAESLKEAIPNLIKSVKNYQDMADKAGQSGSAMQALGKAVISWNAAISIAVTLIAMFGEKIWEWAKGLFSAERNLTNAQRAVKEFNEEVKEGGLGIGEQITQLKKMQSAWNDLGDDLNAKKKYIEDNKGAFEELGIAINDVADAENALVANTDDYVEAMKQRALAAAAYKKAGEYYDKAATLEALNIVDRDKYEAMPDTIAGTFVSISGTGAAAGVSQSMVNTDKTRLGEQMAERDKEIAQYYEMGDALFDLAAAYDLATEAEQRANGGSGSSGGSGGGKGSPTKKPAPFTSSVNSVGTGVATYDVLDSATDAAAENEKLKATLKAKAQMLGASAEEQKAIEQKLADDIALIEETRLGLQEVALNEMLRNEELSAEERLAIEEQLTQTKIALIELQLKAEAERAAEQKDIRDREVEEEKARHEAVLQAQSQLQSATSNILKTAAGFAKENSKAQKALNAAAIVYDTYTAAMSGWKTAQVLPAPFNAVVGAANVAASVAMGALQLRNLMRTAEDGSNAMSAMSAAQSAPSVASSMPASYTRNLQGDNELTEMNKSSRVFVVENDITEAQNRAKVRVQSASF
jgi:chromosome segregation ATPase